MHSDTGAARPYRFRLILLAPVFALVALLCWSVAAPVGSSPDDDFHLASIWCGLGDRPGLCEAVPGHPDERAVPREIVNAPGCFHQKPNRSAACQAATIRDPDKLVPTDRGNFAAHQYPPVYYTVMSVFASRAVTFSAILIRIVNVVLFVGLVTLLYLLLPVLRKPTLLWAWIVSIVPLGTFLIASDNGSAWAIISGGSFWLALVGYFESTGRRKISLAVLSAVLAVMGAGARADAAVYTCIAAVVVSVLCFRRARRFWIDAILPLCIIVVAALFYHFASQSGITSSGFGSGAPTASGHAKLGLLGLNILGVPSLWAGTLGTWDLGWLDTELPAIVPAAMALAFIGVSFVGLRGPGLRKTIAFVIVLVSAWLIPAWVLTQGGNEVGQNVQPRYIYPLVILLAGVAIFRVARAPLRLGRLQLVLVAAAVALANAISLHVSMRRYISGQKIGALDLDHDLQWWWHVPVSPMAVWIVGALAGAIAVVVILRELSWTPLRPPSGPRLAGDPETDALAPAGGPQAAGGSPIDR